MAGADGSAARSLRTTCLTSFSARLAQIQSLEALLVYPAQLKASLDAPGNGIRIRSATFDLQQDLEQAGQEFLAELGLAVWRNQLLAFSVEGSQAWSSYRHAFFSVVNHPDNHALDKTIAAYKALILDDQAPARRRFSTITSADLVRAAAALGDEELNQWVDWYSGLYNVALS